MKSDRGWWSVKKGEKEWQRKENWQRIKSDCGHWGEMMERRKVTKSEERQSVAEWISLKRSDRVKKSEEQWRMTESDSVRVNSDRVEKWKAEEWWGCRMVTKSDKQWQTVNEGWVKNHSSSEEWHLTPAGRVFVYGLHSDSDNRKHRQGDSKHTGHTGSHEPDLEEDSAWLTHTTRNPGNLENSSRAWQFPFEVGWLVFADQGYKKTTHSALLYFCCLTNQVYDDTGPMAVHLLAC